MIRPGAPPTPLRSIDNFHKGNIEDDAANRCETTRAYAAGVHSSDTAQPDLELRTRLTGVDERVRDFRP